MKITHPNAIETADHDEGPPPLYSGSGGFLVPVLIDHRWIMLPPGDPLAEYLVNARDDVGGECRLNQRYEK